MGVLRLDISTGTVAALGWPEVSAYWAFLAAQSDLYAPGDLAEAMGADTLAAFRAVPEAKEIPGANPVYMHNWLREFDPCMSSHFPAGRC